MDSRCRFRKLLERESGVVQSTPPRFRNSSDPYPKLVRVKYQPGDEDLDSDGIRQLTERVQHYFPLANVNYLALAEGAEWAR